VNSIRNRLENELIEDIIESSYILREEDGILKSVLIYEGVDCFNSYLINYIPEQGEDIYFILAHPEEVIILEITRHKKKWVLEKISVTDYLKNCSKLTKRKLRAAKQLLENTKI